MSCDPVTLAGDGCWGCLTPHQMLVAIANILCQILQQYDPMTDCNPLTLAGDGCANCLTPNQLNTALFALTCEIKEAIDAGGDGGSGETCCYNYAGDPNGHVTATAPAFCVDTGSPGRIWAKVIGISTNTGWSANS